MTYQEEIDNEEWWQEAQRKQQPNRPQVKIDDERLKELSAWLDEWITVDDGSRKETIAEMQDIIQELLSARQTIAEWEKSVKEREEYIAKLEWQVANLKEDGERLAEELNYWAYEKIITSEETEIRVCRYCGSSYHEKHYTDCNIFSHLDQHNALMKEIADKKWDAVTKRVVNENIGAWKKLGKEE